MEKNKYGGYCGVSHPDKRVYGLWYGMLRRCYDKKQQERNRGKSYANCTVCDRWLNYSNFAHDITLLFGYEDWLNKKGYCLDKDTINPGNTVYSRGNCCFIPYTDNIREANRRHPDITKNANEARKIKYVLEMDGVTILFDSEKTACEFLGVKKCSVSSCYHKGYKCKGYRITRIGNAKMDGGVSDG